jgi:hypothetical protein
MFAAITEVSEELVVNCVSLIRGRVPRPCHAYQPIANEKRTALTATPNMSFQRRLFVGAAEVMLGVGEVESASNANAKSDAE